MVVIVSPRGRASWSSEAPSAAPRATADAFDRIVARLRRLEEEPALLVQSGERVGPFRPNADAVALSDFFALPGSVRQFGYIPPLLQNRALLLVSSVGASVVESPRAVRKLLCLCVGNDCG